MHEVLETCRTTFLKTDSSIITPEELRQAILPGSTNSLGYQSHRNLDNAQSHRCCTLRRSEPSDFRGATRPPNPRKGHLVPLVFSTRWRFTAKNRNDSRTRWPILKPPQTSKPRRRLSKKRPVNQSSQSVSRILRHSFSCYKHGSWLALLLHSLRARCFLATFKCLQGISWGPTPVVTRRTAIISTAASHGTLMNIAYRQVGNDKKYCLEQELPMVKHPNHKTGGNNLPLYHIVPRCVVRHTPLQTDYWLKEPLVSQAEFHVAACTTCKKVATYKPNWTMQSKIIQPRAINHDWTLFHTCYNSKCEAFDTQELASIMCFELKQDTQTSLGSTQHHSHDFGSYLISYGVDDVHPTIDLVYSRCPQQPASCLNDT